MIPVDSIKMSNQAPKIAALGVGVAVFAYLALRKPRVKDAPPKVFSPKSQTTSEKIRTEAAKIATPGVPKE